MQHPVDFVLIVVLKSPDTVLAPVQTHQHVQYVPVDTFLFCTLKVIMVVVASSHGILESRMISRTSHWATPKSPNSERGNVTPTASGDKSDKFVTKVPISSAAVATVRAKVLLNVIPVVISAENGNTVSTDAFSDSCCTDTLVEQDLVDHLCIQGTPWQIGINTISSSDNVSFALTLVAT